MLKRTRKQKEGLSASARKAAQEREVIQNDYQRRQNPHRVIPGSGQLERLIIYVLDKILRIQPQPNAHEQNRQQSQQQNHHSDQSQNGPQSPFQRIFHYINDLVNRPDEFVKFSKKLFNELRQQGYEISSVENCNRALLNILYVGGIPMTVLSNLGNSIGIPDFDPRQSIDYAALGGPKRVLDDSLDLATTKDKNLYEMGGLSTEVENLDEKELSIQPNEAHFHDPFATKPNPLAGV